VTPCRLVVIVSGFPRRSETFALAELAALDDRGMLAAVFSTKPGEDGLVQPAVRRLRRRVQQVSGSPAAQAIEAAHRLAGMRVAGVHAYFAHAPAAVAADLARLLGVPFGFSVHARDARKVDRAELHDRARRAACVIACNSDVAAEFGGSGASVHIVPHGVDIKRFTAQQRSPRDVLNFLAVGRLVEKKGFHVLLDALSRLKAAWRLRLVGAGSEHDRLAAQAEALGIADRVRFTGPATHDSLPYEYARTDVMVVPSICDRSGDRDGLPNVILEAMASGVAIVASDTGAIRSAVRHDFSGLLVPAGDSAALAAALTQLAAAPDARHRLGRAARDVAEREFDDRACTRRLASVLGEAYA
jgi:glycosyltransferase involved in cell wall biosynthesis